MKTIAKSFPDLGKALSWMRMEDTLLETLRLWPNNLLASLYFERLVTKQATAKQIATELIEAHIDNPSAIETMIGVQLLNELKTLLYGA